MKLNYWDSLIIACMAITAMPLLAARIITYEKCMSENEKNLMREMEDIDSNREELEKKRKIWEKFEE